MFRNTVDTEPCSAVRWVTHFNVTPFQSGVTGCGMQWIETEMTQTLRSFVLGGVKILNWIPDAAICSCPCEVTDAGGFVTAHLWRKKDRDQAFPPCCVGRNSDNTCKGHMGRRGNCTNGLEFSSSFHVSSSRQEVNDTQIKQLNLFLLLLLFTEK